MKVCNGQTNPKKIILFLKLDFTKAHDNSKSKFEIPLV